MPVLNKMSVLAALVVMALNLVSAVASPLSECASSKHQPIAEIQVPWGTEYSKAYSLLKKQYLGRAVVSKQSAQEIKVNFRPSKSDLFDFMSFKFTEGQLTFVGISYSDKFQRRMGGIMDAWKLLAKKLIERYSEKADSVDSPRNDTLVATWKSQPVRTELYGKDPNSLFLKTQCSPLREQLEAKVRSRVDVGF